MTGPWYRTLQISTVYSKTGQHISMRNVCITIGTATLAKFDNTYALSMQVSKGDPHCINAHQSVPLLVNLTSLFFAS